MPGQFDFQSNFPIAGVAQLLADRSTKEAAMRAQQQQQLVEGLKTFGSGVQSLVDRRNQMAQALAQAHIYAQTPEGQALMAPTQTPTPGYGAPVPQGAAGPSGPVTITPSSIDENTLATAFRSEQPGNFLANLQSQSATKKAYDLETMKEANAQKLAQAKLQSMKDIFTAGLGPKYGAINQQDVSNIQNNISSLEQKKAELTKSLPGTFGTYIGNDAAKAARTQIAQIDQQIADYKNQLASQGKTGRKSMTMSPDGSLTLTTDSGVSYTVNP